MTNLERLRRGRAAHELFQDLRLMVTHTEALLAHTRGLSRRWLKDGGPDSLVAVAELQRLDGHYRAEITSLRSQMSGLVLRMRELERK